ncbi:MAG: carbohydrate-binding family 9-like protein [Planctomycetes bacterium]|nr:carbohydrate-binding family 9-like protein [Planctomycetota bacterium]MBL7041843.1 carbohydrate-binding family 9-like protein [Pirellulaceae bacterium]
MSRPLAAKAETHFVDLKGTAMSIFHRTISWRSGWLPLALLLLVLAPASDGDAATVTRRLSTGLTATDDADGLPKAWVAPAATAPKMDGQLDDNAWSVTKPIVLGRLERVGRAEPRTEVSLIHNDGVLYIGVKLDEPNLGQLRREVTQRNGPVYRDDSVELFLSPNPDAEYYQIIVNANGVISDRIGHGNPGAFDSKAETATALGERGWSMEIAVPMTSLGFDGEMPVKWRGNFYRNRQAGGAAENQAWSPTLSADYDVPTRFGHLLFTDEPPVAGRRDESKALKGITLTQLHAGGAVLQFDLSTFAGKKVHRALLRVERAPMDGLAADARTNVEIYPLTAPLTEGGKPKAAEKPLALAAPWCRWFDITDLVATWAGGRTSNTGLYVKQFPGWRPETTFLDVMFDGEPDDIPQPVTGLGAVHHAGQTFLTWKEIDDLVGKDDVKWGEMKQLLADLDKGRRVRYCVYRSGKPITAATLAAAELIAEVKPLSGWNINGRNIERPIDRVVVTATYMKTPRYGSVFDSARIDGEYGVDCPTDRFVIPGGETQLLRGTGLYVHTPGNAGKAYYAVLASVDGVQNTSAIAATKAVTEIAGAGEPVLQGELPPGPLWRYKQKRLHYVRWVAPPLSNLPSRYFNWSVGVPETMSKAAPLELNLHHDRGSYWRTQYRLERDSIVISPHDFPFPTWWYGYHESRDTLRSFSQGTIHNYTQRRLLSFVEWASTEWPVDRGRVIVTGMRYRGGFGALRLGVSFPDVFALVVTGHGLPDARYGVNEVNKFRWSQGQFDSLVAALGQVDWELKTADGVNVWDALDVNRQISALPPTAKLPLIAMTSRNDWIPSREFYQLMLAKRRPVMGSYMWGGTTLLPVSATSTWPNAARQLVRSDRPLLAFKSATVDELLAGGKQGEFNWNYRWRPDTVVDKPGRCEVVVFYQKKYGHGDPQTADATIRRFARFNPSPGATVSYSVTPVGSGDAAQSGTLTIGADGLLVIPGVDISEAGVRIVVTAQ